MRRTAKIIAALFLVAIIGVPAALVFLPRRPANPVYADRPLSEWVGNWGVVELVPGSATLVRTNVTALDLNAAPYLVSVLRRQDSPWAKRYMRDWPKLPLWLRQRLPLPTSADALRANAVTMLAGTGPGSPETIAALLEVAEKFGGTNVTPGLWGVTFSERNEVVTVLGKIGTNNPVAIAGLCRLINENTNLYLTIPAIHSLGLVGGQSRSAVDFLVRRVLSGNYSQETLVSIYGPETNGPSGPSGRARPRSHIYGKRRLGRP